MTSTGFQSLALGLALLFTSALPTTQGREKELSNCDSGQIAINPPQASAKLLYPGKWEATTLNRYT